MTYWLNSLAGSKLFEEMMIEFTKLQGAGNDFVLIEDDNRGLDYSKLAGSICDRHFGIGADGLLVLLPSEKADFRMQVFNPDGSEAEACGNGIRCFVRYVFEKGLVKNSVDELTIKTMAGVRRASLYKTGKKLIKIRVKMGSPKFEAEEVPVLPDGPVDIIPILDYPVTVEGRELHLGFVSMGNPHAVYFSDEPVSGFPLSCLG